MRLAVIGAAQCLRGSPKGEKGERLTGDPAGLTRCDLRSCAANHRRERGGKRLPIDRGLAPNRVSKLVWNPGRYRSGDSAWQVLS